MPYTDAERQRIAETVRRTRINKQWDKEPAARAAKVNSITWKRIEDAEGVRDASLAKVLSTLGLTVEGALNGDDPVVDRVQDSRPDPVSVEVYPAVALNLSDALWRAVTALAESPEGDPQREAKADYAVLAAADQIVDVLLALNAGPPAKPLIQEITNRAYEILHLDKGTDHVVEIATESPASPEGNKDQEDASHRPQTRTPLPVPAQTRRDLAAKNAGEDGSDDADQAHEL